MSRHGFSRSPKAPGAVGLPVLCPQFSGAVFPICSIIVGDRGDALPLVVDKKIPETRRLVATVRYNEQWAWTT